MAEIVIGTLYTEWNAYGDFNWMLKQPEYEDALFIYGDDIESIENNTLERSGGTAVIRPYRLFRSSPVPTGSLEYGGYPSLTEKIKTDIQACIAEARDKIEKYEYKRVFYSATTKDGTLGSASFYVGRDVLEYITEQIKSMQR